MIVSDTSPVIGLTRIGRLDLLERVFGEVLIPKAVEDEVMRHPSGFRGARPEWLRVRPVQNHARADELKRGLDPGESEAIALAIELGTRLLIDEEPGRRVAESLGIERIGTVGALLAAKRAGILPELTPVVLQLRGSGFRVSDTLLAELRIAAGE